MAILNYQNNRLKSMDEIDLIISDKDCRDVIIDDTIYRVNNSCRTTGILCSESD